MPETQELHELKKAMYDLTQKVKENNVPKEQLVQMVEDAVAKSVPANRTPAEDQGRFDEVPEPESLIRNFDIKSVRDLCTADNVRKDMFGNARIGRGADGLKELSMKDPRLTEIQTAIDDLMIVHSCMLVSGPQSYKDLARQNPRKAISEDGLCHYWRRARVDPNGLLESAH
jgi:hypothetical protein